MQSRGRRSSKHVMGSWRPSIGAKVHVRSFPGPFAGRTLDRPSKRAFSADAPLGNSHQIETITQKEGRPGFCVKQSSETKQNKAPGSLRTISIRFARRTLDRVGPTRERDAPSGQPVGRRPASH